VITTENVNDEQSLDKIGNFLDEYVKHVHSRIDLRNGSEVPLDLYHGHVPSVFAGLLARQGTLTIKLALCPPLWDGHVAPMLLRGMVECLVTARWIMLDPLLRATEYISYALGQAKLTLSHMQNEIEGEQDPETKERLLSFAQMQESWIVSQRLIQFIDVNLGSWSGMSIRKMCDEIGDIELYKFWFVPFSTTVHNTWQHVSLCNTKICTNPLHMEHRLSYIATRPMDADIMRMSAKFFDKLVIAFDDFYSLKLDDISAETFFKDGLIEILEQ
jgi:hypothetical protein